MCVCVSCGARKRGRKFEERTREQERLDIVNARRGKKYMGRWNLSCVIYIYKGIIRCDCSWIFVPEDLDLVNEPDGIYGLYINSRSASFMRMIVIFSVGEFSFDDFEF